jgi:hypothetical protein
MEFLFFLMAFAARRECQPFHAELWLIGLARAACRLGIKHHKTTTEPKDPKGGKKCKKKSIVPSSQLIPNPQILEVLFRVAPPESRHGVASAQLTAQLLNALPSHCAAFPSTDSSWTRSKQ